MATTEEQVKHATRLLKLSFSKEELTDSTNQPDKIIDTAELLGEVNTTEVLSTSSVSESINVMHENVATSGMDRKKLIQSAPRPEDSYTRAPATMDNGEVGVQWKDYTINR